MTNIKIKEIAIYHPENHIPNDFFFQHFDKRGKDIRHLLKHVGRENRYWTDPDKKKETGITMAIEASKKVLENAHLTGKDIDMIIYSTQIPDQLIPMNALYIHQAINASNHSIAFDLNGNCIGMTLAVDFAARYMQGNSRIQRALVIGSDHFSPILNPEDELSYSLFGDLASAVILESTEESAGFIDSLHYTDSVNPNPIMFPVNGLVQTLKEQNDPYMKFEPFDASPMYPHVYDSMREILNQHGLKPSDVKCCFSQSNKAILQRIQENMGFHEDQIIFVADKYGYPGTSSPFIALHEAIQTGKIQHGDYVLFWTVGSVYEFITMLFKY